ncbi:hypothetical protein [Sinorhizobium sp. BG8]|uniref:hypothetical protein n=1 Tax=Sinorhizobium sp. BG8 TaxID=2613773 RepID=UPI00193CBF5C|nr:hypothetical protein [Sinorhizobium sp. BG8]QRM54729.1 hypothetical protein F3Y30_09375 [Sinorhizobium sp. BG8]
MPTDLLPTFWEDEEYVYIPEEFFQYLPPEMLKDVSARKLKGLSVLEVVDKDIKNLIRLGNAFPTMISLRYIQYRLANTKFELTSEGMLEQEMLTSVFAITYARLIHGGLGSGVSRDSLPAHLRTSHDYLLEVRNKRFAHNVGHESISSGIAIDFDETRFNVKLNFNMGFHVGGANEWSELVAFLDGLMHEKLHIQLARLKEKTGYDWTFPTGPAPPWADKSAETMDDGTERATDE